MCVDYVTCIYIYVLCIKYYNIILPSITGMFFFACNSIIHTCLCVHHSEATPLGLLRKPADSLKDHPRFVAQSTFKPQH